MRIFIFIFTVLLISVNSFAQKTYKIKGFPGINSVISYNFSIVDTLEYNLKDISKKEWNFSDLKSSEKVIMETINPKDTPFDSLYPEANYCTKFDSYFEIYNFEKINKKSFSYIGSIYKNNEHKETSKRTKPNLILFDEFQTNDTILHLFESKTNFYSDVEEIYTNMSKDSCFYIYKQDISLILPDNKTYNTIFVIRKYLSNDSIFIYNKLEKNYNYSSTYYDWYINKDGILINVLKIIESGYEYAIYYLDKIEKLDGIIIDQ